MGKASRASEEPQAEGERSRPGRYSGRAILILTVPFTPTPEGFCQCGCGRHTTIAPEISDDFGWVKAKRISYVHGHGRRKLRNYGALSTPLFRVSDGVDDADNDPQCQKLTPESQRDKSWDRRDGKCSAQSH